MTKYSEPHDEMSQAPWTATGLLGRPVIATGFLPVVRWISRGQRRRTPVFPAKNETEITRRWKAIVLADPCPYCGGIVQSENIDHVEPRSAGGSGHWFNLTGACFECNRDKGSTPLLLFMLRHEPLPASARDWEKRSKVRNKAPRKMARDERRARRMAGWTA